MKIYMVNSKKFTQTGFGMLLAIFVGLIILVMIIACMAIQVTRKQSLKSIASQQAYNEIADPNSTDNLESILKGSSDYKELSLTAPLQITFEKTITLEGSSAALYSYKRLDTDITYRAYEPKVFYYTVNTGTKKVEPYFGHFINELLKAWDDQQKEPIYTTITNTELRIAFTQDYKLTNLIDGSLEFIQTDAINNLLYCELHPKLTYCQDLKAELGQKYTDLLTNYLAGKIYIIKTAELPEKWVLTNVLYQGKTLQELLDEGMDSTADYIDINNKKFYNIGMGCCGSVERAYIYKTKNNINEDILIFFVAKTVDYYAVYSGMHETRNLSLEKILTTLKDTNL